MNGEISGGRYRIAKRAEVTGGRLKHGQVGARVRLLIDIGVMRPAYCDQRPGMSVQLMTASMGAN